MSKHTALDWLKKQLENYGDPSNLKLDWETLDELIEQAKQMEKEQNKIDFPTDEDIDIYKESTGYYGHCTDEFREGIELGAKWMREKIKGGNK